MAEDIVVAELLDTLDSADTFGPAGDTFVGAAHSGEIWLIRPETCTVCDIYRLLPCCTSNKAYA